jgi:hypothetical protein
MPKRTPVAFIALSFCALSFCLGCGTKPQMCACPASYYDYVYAVGTDEEITTFPVHQIGATLGTPTATPGPATSLGIALTNSAFLYASDPQAQGGPSIDARTINV